MDTNNMGTDELIEKLLRDYVYWQKDRNVKKCCLITAKTLKDFLYNHLQIETEIIPVLCSGKLRIDKYTLVDMISECHCVLKYKEDFIETTYEYSPISYNPKQIETYYETLKEFLEDNSHLPPEIKKRVATNFIQFIPDTKIFNDINALPTDQYALSLYVNGSICLKNSLKKLYKDN